MDRTILDRQGIMEVLPHRDAMLLLDTAELLPDGTARGTYRVRGDEWFLQGHFPGNPVVPGVVLCEIIAQSACVMMASSLEGGTPYYAKIDKTRFRRVVRPGDRLELSTRLVRGKVGVYVVSGSARVDGELACEGEFTFVVSANAHTGGQ